MASCSRLLTALGIAVLLGAVIIVAYGENPFIVYGAILNGSFGDGMGSATCSRTPAP